METKDFTKKLACLMLANNRYAERPELIPARQWAAVKSAMERRYMAEWMATPDGLYNDDKVWRQTFNSYRLTTANVQKIIGKKVVFFARQFSGNYDVIGVAKVNGYTEGKRNPIDAEGILWDGDFMNFAIVNEDGEICIGDSDRPVFFAITNSTMGLSDIRKRFVWNSFNAKNWAFPKVSDDMIVVIADASKPIVAIYDCTGLSEQEREEVARLHGIDITLGCTYTYHVEHKIGNTFFLAPRKR